MCNNDLLLQCQWTPNTNNVTIPSHVPRLKDDTNIDKSSSALQEIIPGLYIGMHNITCNMKVLLKCNITNIITAYWENEKDMLQIFPGINYCYLEIPDQEMFSVIPYFTSVAKVMEDFEKQGSTLISSRWAVSRAPTIVISYLMGKYNISFRQSYHIVHRRRPCIHPNVSFVAQLLEYEPILQAIQLSHGGHSHSGQTRRATAKRKIQEVGLASVQINNVIYDITMFPNVDNMNKADIENVTPSENEQHQTVSSSTDDNRLIFNLPCMKNDLNYNSKLIPNFNTTVAEAMDI